MSYLELQLSLMVFSGLGACNKANEKFVLLEMMAETDN